MNNCIDCRQDFETDNPNDHICPTCRQFRKPHKKKRSKKRAKKILTFAEILHIAKVYDKINGKYLHYGDIVNLIDSNAEHCICCNAVIPEGKLICPQCERVGEQ